MLGAIVAVAVLASVTWAHAATMPAYDRLPAVGWPVLRAPTALALDTAESLYIVESSRGTLLIYDAGGLHQRTLWGLRKPISVAVDDNGRIVVGNSDAGNVEVYDTGLTPLLTLGSGDREFAKPTGIAVDGAGTIYVADAGRNQVAVYHSDGTYWFAFGGTGTGNGKFNFPTAIAIDRAAGEVIVSDLPVVSSMNGSNEGARVQIFDPTGGFKRSFGTYGQGPGKLTRPMGVVVDGARRIYVTDAQQNVIELFDSVTGAFLGAIYDAENPLRTPLGLAMGGSNRVFVASLNTGTVEVYGIQPYALPASTPTRTPVPTQTLTPTSAPTMPPTDTPGEIPTDAPTMLPAHTPTATPATTAAPSPTASATATATPAVICGDGVLNLGEQCDDGNLLNGDGCRDNCTYELIPGNGRWNSRTDQYACLLEWAVVNPHGIPATDQRGRRYFVQTCEDNDPTCDFDPAPGACVFHVTVCLNNTDPNLPACPPLGVAAPVKIRYPEFWRDPDNFTAMTVALQSLRDPRSGNSVTVPLASPQTDVCTTPIPIRVPLRGRGLSLRGHVVLRTLSHSVEGAPWPVTDVDSLQLVCAP